MGAMHVLKVMGRASVGKMAALALALGACGDDGAVTPTSDSTSGTTQGPLTSTATMAATSEGGPSTGATTTGLDSKGTDSGTTDDTSAGTLADSSSSGDPNLAPEATDDVYFVREDAAPLVVDVGSGVLANDADPEGSALTVTDSDPASAEGGSVAMAADGSFQYDPPADYVGDDTFGYQVSDEQGAMVDVTVTVTVGVVELPADDVAAGIGGFVIDGIAVFDESGTVVSGGGDVNGDGLSDIVVTSSTAGLDEGRVWVVFGKADGSSVDLADIEAGIGGFVITGESSDDPAGPSAAIVGDIDGDTLADVLVGAPLAGFRGRAYLVHGKVDTAAVDLADVAMGVGGFPLEGAASGEDAGTAVAAAGDVNGDGLADVLVGAPEGGPIPGGGRVYVVYGKSDDTAVALGDVFIGVGGFTIFGEGFDDNAGASVAAAQDVNGDGLDDVLLGAPLADAGGADNSGRCYVVFGKTDTTVVDLDSLGAGGFSIEGFGSFDNACTAISGLGDFNGDGLSELAVGSPNDENGLGFQGRVYVVHGKTDTSAVLLTDIGDGVGGFALDGEDTAHFLGLAVGGAGDFDADGLADLVLGAPNAGGPGIRAGRGYLVFGKTDTAGVPLADLTTRRAGIRMLPEAALDELGWAVAGAGDVNGDGFSDVVVSARRADPAAGESAGRTYVVFGGNQGGAGDALRGDGRRSVGRPGRRGCDRWRRGCRYNPRRRWV